MPLDSWPFISIVVAVRNAEKTITQCLSSLASIDYHSKYEVIVVDGMSNDRTPKLANDFCRRYSNFELLMNPKVNAAAGNNIGIRESRGDLVAFVDGDIVVKKTWLTNLVAFFMSAKETDSKIVGVGGPNLTPPGASFIERCIRYATSSSFASLRSIAYAYREKAGPVNSIANCNALYLKDVLLKVGGFDDQFQKGLDAEINLRLRKVGYKLFYTPTAQVYHYQNENVKSFVKRMFKYGRTRASVLKKHPKENVTYLLPLCLTPILILSIMEGFFLHLMVLYMIVSWGFGLKILKEFRCYREYATFPLFNIVSHSAHFLGFVYGLIQESIEMLCSR